MKARAVPPAGVPRSRGRPRDPERVARVLQAAKHQFREHGFERASIEAIAEASGVSKVTIYSYFPTKAELFQAAISHRVAADFAAVDWATLDPAAPRAALTKIGRAFLALMRSADVVNHHRSLYGAIGAEPTAAEGFFQSGPVALATALADYLRAADRAGSLVVRDPAMAANQFFSLFLGLGHIRTLLGLAAPASREDEALLKANVELFLAALGAPARRAKRR